ncbi:MAG: hypothetical protein AABM30_02365 [Actinomycetota bacterium]
MYDDEWRVEIDLDDEEHGYGLGERLRAADLDDEARERLGRRAVVTRDGSRVFLYTGSEPGAGEAERVARELVTADGLSAEITVTRWHPVAEEWRDAAIPLPQSEAEEREETRLKEEHERQEVEEEGSYDWLLKVALSDRSEAALLETRLRAEGLPVHRRWRYVTVDVLTEERANELGSRLRGELPNAEVWIEANPDDIPSPAFVLLESRL